MSKLGMTGRSGRIRTGVVGVALCIVLGVTGGLHTMARGASGDPLPQVPANIQYQIDPGPGWPQGWTPPAAPTQLPPGAADHFQLLQQYAPNPPKYQALWVLNPLPAWTKQYPYTWEWRYIVCGQTDYEVAYPVPDSMITKQYFNKMYHAQYGADDPKACTFSGITQIVEDKPLTPEQLQQRELDIHANDDMYKAKLKDRPDGGLKDCQTDQDGSPANILVCFNFGAASPRFDAPAYLDTQVGRVRVPIRFVSDMVGADVSWDNASQTATIHFPAVSKEIARPVPNPGLTFADLVRPHDYIFFTDRFKWTLKTTTQPERTIQLTVGQPYAVVDGQHVDLDAPPVIQPPGRTMVPVRFISEEMGAKVYWVGSTPIWDEWDGSVKGRYQVHIITQFWPFYDYPDWHLETLAKRF